MKGALWSSRAPGLGSTGRPRLDDGSIKIPKSPSFGPFGLLIGQRRADTAVALITVLSADQQEKTELTHTPRSTQRNSGRARTGASKGFVATSSGSIANGMLLAETKDRRRAQRNPESASLHCLGASTGD